MKDHRRERRAYSLESLEGSLADITQAFVAHATGLVDPKIELEYSYEDVSAYMAGWIPLTDIEKKRIETTKVRDREAAKKRATSYKARRLKQFQKDAKNLGYRVEKEPNAN